MIVEASRVAFCFTSSRVMISLGVKPVNGGRPASESKISIVIVVKAGVLGHEEEMSDIFVAEIKIRERNIAAVIII